MTHWGWYAIKQNSNFYLGDESFFFFSFFLFFFSLGKVNVYYIPTNTVILIILT